MDRLERLWAGGRKDADKRSNLRKRLILLAALIAIIVVAIDAYIEDKTFWDVLELLVIPLALAGIAIIFSQSEREADRKLATDRQREMTLHNYIDKMTNLLLEEGLSIQPPNNDIRTVARAWTLTSLEWLGGFEKSLLIGFLYEAKLILAKPIIDLEGANLWEIEIEQGHFIGINLTRADLFRASITNSNLSNAELHNSNLMFADFSETKLINANLNAAFLSFSDFSRANLTRANLSEAELDSTRLTDADLTDSDLTGANLSEANLKGAKVTTEQLAKAKSLEGATMPDGTVHE